ncbi:MAG: DsrE family protein [Desulfuromonadales bacterium]|nr:DsrE family protein [Desulfuromonadales bacterium]
MRTSARRIFPRCSILALTFALLLFGAAPLLGAEYAALEGVDRLDTVVDYTNGSAKEATLIFPAIREIYQDKSVTSLKEEPRTVIIFHGEAVNLITTDRKGKGKDHQAYEEVAKMIRQFKEEGVKMEVCMYAVKVMGVDPATLMPEIDQVGNGFIAAAGYQAQGYSLIPVP